jgi:putative restriction endonuclease
MHRTVFLKELCPNNRAHVKPGHRSFFWRLQNDGVWKVHPAGALKPRQANTDPRNSDLLAHDARGGFSLDVQAALRADPARVAEIAARLLENHFPESYHPDIQAAVGLTLDTCLPAGSKRDPAFRQRLLTAYEYRCAVCGFDVRLGTVSIALDAAHIHWHQAGRPSTEMNGLALCVLHHKTFDLGAFTVNREGVLLVSDQAHGTEGFHQALLRHHGRRIARPQRPEWKPEPGHLAWHARGVFRGAARHLDSQTAYATATSRRRQGKARANCPSDG